MRGLIVKFTRGIYMTTYRTTVKPIIVLLLNVTTTYCGMIYN